mmetsp:Transcript_32338/g.86675  ORF Transcript_32338/g.86675 Transcript_32338/m.86675 type:complete len:238 (-) Transcript_32338:604-1317(-)
MMLSSPAANFTELLTALHVMTDAARATRQNTGATNPKRTARHELMSAAEAPHNKNTKLSAKFAKSSKNSVHECWHSGVSCGAPYRRNMMPAKRFATIPERPTVSASEYVKNAQTKMYITIPLVLLCSRAKRIKNTRTSATPIPKNTEQDSSSTTSVRHSIQCRSVYDNVSKLMTFQITMTTASFMTDSPKTKVFSRGCRRGISNFPKVERVATGSTAEISAANTRHSRRVKSGAKLA